MTVKRNFLQAYEEVLVSKLMSVFKLFQSVSNRSVISLLILLDSKSLVLKLREKQSQLPFQKSSLSKRVKIKVGSWAL
jgi:flagellar motor switch protein FliG